MSIETVEGGHVTTPKGFRAGATAAGIKKREGALDLALLFSERECSAGGVFTQNLVKGAPVIVSQERLVTGHIRAVVANSGCSNSMTGQGGYEDAVEMTRIAAKHLGISADEVAVASTGVVGVRMPMDKVLSGMPKIEVTPEGGPSYARAIMTTDTRAKETAVRVTTAAGSYAVGGCAKGSGMIHPDMATMLSYVTTDAAVEAGYLREVQREIAGFTLNMISIDGDTSCSDTFQLLANGAAGLPEIKGGTPEALEFREALLAVCTHLARELARDGEGAQRLMTVEVTGAASMGDARKIARTISNSPLVKTAVTGCDPNWGRILVAAGRAGALMDPSKASLLVQGIPMLDKGTIVAFDEKSTSDAMDAPEVVIKLDLALGSHHATAWGCDLTTDYVHINADYRT